MSIKHLWDIKFDEPSDRRAQIPIVYVRCGFGPLIGWADAMASVCAACYGDGSLYADGHDGKEYEFNCPTCNGNGKPANAGSDLPPLGVAVWADVNGNVVQPAVGLDGYPTSAWLIEYAQRAAACSEE